MYERRLVVWCEDLEDKKRLRKKYVSPGREWKQPEDKAKVQSRLRRISRKRQGAIFFSLLARS